MRDQGIEKVTVIGCQHCSAPLVIGSDAHVYCPNGHGGVPIHEVIARLTEGTIRHENQRLN